MLLSANITLSSSHSLQQLHLQSWQQIAAVFTGAVEKCEINTFNSLSPAKSKKQISDQKNLFPSQQNTAPVLEVQTYGASQRA